MVLCKGVGTYNYGGQFWVFSNHTNNFLTTDFDEIFANRGWG